MRVSYFLPYEKDVQIHDIGPGGAGKNKVSQTIEKTVGIVIAQAFIHKAGAMFHGTSQRRTVHNWTRGIGGSVCAIGSKADGDARRGQICQRPNAMQCKFLIASPLSIAAYPDCGFASADNAGWAA